MSCIEPAVKLHRLSAVSELELETDYYHADLLQSDLMAADDSDQDLLQLRELAGDDGDDDDGSGARATAALLPQRRQKQVVM